MTEPMQSNRETRAREVLRQLTNDLMRSIDRGCGPLGFAIRSEEQKPLADAISALLSFSDAERLTESAQGEVFGYWVEQKHADPVLLRKPAYIPEPSDLRRVTPLYAALNREAADWRHSAYSRVTFAELAGRALQSQEDAEDGRETCVNCEGEGMWEHCPSCSLTFGRAIDLRRLALSTPSAAPTDEVRVPDGWKLVSVEPTEAMIHAGGSAALEHATGDAEPFVANVWSAMLTATPTPPAIA